MFCSHCGKEVTVGAKFCPNCGAAIENQSAPTEGQPKAPTVEQPGNPIKKLIAGNGWSGKGKKRIPKPLIIVAAVLVLFIGFGAILNLFGDSDKPNSDPSESQTAQESVVPYREFNGEEFLGVLGGSVVYMGTDEGGETTTVGNAVMLNYKHDVFEKNFSNVLKNNDATWETIKKCLEDDWFNSESVCAELDYISEVEWKDHSYDYFRLNVTDLGNLNSRFEFSPDWTSDQEIYVIAEVGKISDSWADELGEQIQQFSIQFFINQFNENPTSTLGQTNQSTGDTTIHSTGTTLVETDYYTVEIPMEWEKYCTYEETSEIGEHRLTFYIKDEYMEDGYDGTLLELAAVENPENLDDELYTYECQICEYGVVLFDLMRRTPENVSVQRQYQELLISLQEFVPYVVQSIKEKDGYTLSYDPIEEDDGIPYVNVVSNVLGQQYTSWNGEIIVVGSELSHEYLNDLDNVTYYCYFYPDTTDSRASYEVYGIRDGFIVAQVKCLDDFSPKVKSCITSDFDGIAPKTITEGIFNHHIWKMDNGYFVCCAYNSGQDYINDEVYTCAFYADKDICSLLTMN